MIAANKKLSDLKLETRKLEEVTRRFPDAQVSMGEYRSNSVNSNLKGKYLVEIKVTGTGIKFLLRKFVTFSFQKEDIRVFGTNQYWLDNQEIAEVLNDQKKSKEVYDFVWSSGRAVVWQ